METLECVRKIDEHGHGPDLFPYCSLENITITKFSRITFPVTSQNVSGIKLKLRAAEIVTFSSEQFERADEITQIDIDHCSGLYNLENFLFGTRLESIEVKYSDLEVVGEKPFLKLFRLVTLRLENNKIKTVHKNAFVDLTKTTEIDLSFNQIQRIDEDTFASCLELRYLRLKSNFLSSVPPKLVSRNVKLTELILAQNKILMINKEGFNLPLSTLTTLDLRDNLCVDSKFLIDFSLKIRMYKALTTCFINYEIIHYINGTIDNLLKTNENVKFSHENVSSAQAADVEETTEMSFTALKPFDKFEEFNNSRGNPTVEFPERPDVKDKCREIDSFWMFSLTAFLITSTIVVIVIFMTYQKILREAMNHVPIAMTTVTL